MTDREELKVLFDRWKVKYREETRDLKEGEGKYVVILEVPGYDDRTTVIGYGGFVTEFYFDDEDKFLSVGLWE